jgi:hypothetical protein
VVFGKDGARQVTAMYATSQQAARLADELEAFAARQSVFVAPRAAEDAQRIASLRATESLLGGEPPARVDALAHADADVPRVTRAPAGRFCPGCGAKAGPDAKFCSACGTALPAPDAGA